MANNTLNPYKFDEQRPQQHPNCVACDEMLLDATDGLLSDSDQAFFDRHLTGCVTCANSFADAQRGAAFLSLLKAQRPEPNASLVDRILSQTSGEQLTAAPETSLFVVPAAQPPAALPANVLSFRSQSVQTGSRFTRFARLAMEPRFAMTAAMAFFSIALTLNLTGVRLDQLRTADLNPLHLRRSYYEANAQAVRYCDNLRVVRVLESRVDDIRQAQSFNQSDDNSSAPAKQPRQQQPEAKPQSDTNPKPEPHGTSRQDSAPLATHHLQNARLELIPDLFRRSNPAAYLTSNEQEGGLA